MAPREANNPFPDNYLSLDYDSSAPILAHDPVPLPAIAGDIDEQSFDQNTAMNVGDLDVSIINNEENADSGIGVASPMSTRATRNRSRSQQPSVDPLSIDPTENDPNVMLQFGVLAAAHRGGEFMSSDDNNANVGWNSSTMNQQQSTSPSPRPRRLNRLFMAMAQDASTENSEPNRLVSPLSGMSSSRSPVALSLTSSSVSTASAGTNELLHAISPRPTTISNSYQGVNFATDGTNSLEILTASDGNNSNNSVNNQSFLTHSTTIARPGTNGNNPHYTGSVLDQSLSEDEDSNSSVGAAILPDLDLSQGSMSLRGSVVNNDGVTIGNSTLDEDELSSQSSNSSENLIQMQTDDTGVSQNLRSILSEKASDDYLLNPSNEDSYNVSTSNNLSLTFHSSTTVSDLKYFAERGCIVPLLFALNTPRLKTLGCRMLADYAKMPLRRVAVASNKRILGFLLHCMSTNSPNNADWMGREYAVETIRSLTATEESDEFLMSCPDMLSTLALCAKGGPFNQSIPLSSPRGRLHACIAIMNLSCGKSNKLEIAKCQHVLETMRDVMLLKVDNSDSRHASEARLKATTCIKNLSNADANDSALLLCNGLVEALGKVAATTCCSPHSNDITTTTNSCLALMNLSISKANKHVVFQTNGVMDALMAVIATDTPNTEAKVKACSALSNLAIGYDNKIPMFKYPNFVETILNVIKTDVGGEARTKACSILWSFAAEMKNQVPVVQRGDILPVLVQVAEEDTITEARFKCVAALTLLAESLQNALPLLQSGALAPLMDILHEAGPDPTQWKGQTASWCVGFLMNLSQSDEAVPYLRDAGVVELLTPLLTLNHYQSLKAAMAVTFVCRYDEDDTTYDLLRKTETVIPKIISLLYNTLAARGGNGYKYGVFTLRSSVGCIASLASGPDFMKERIATGPVFDSLLQVISDFCVDGGSPGAIVGGGRDDVISATLAMRALHSLTGHLIPVPGPGKSSLPFDPSMEEKLVIALGAFDTYPHPELHDRERNLARETKIMIVGYELNTCTTEEELENAIQNTVTPSINSSTSSGVLNCCGFPISVVGFGSAGGLIADHGSNKQKFSSSKPLSRSNKYSDVVPMDEDTSFPSPCVDDDIDPPVRTFLLADARGRRFAVPIDPSGGRRFYENRIWCYRRGRFCRKGEVPDPNFQWTKDLQKAYNSALKRHQIARGNKNSENSSSSSGS